MTTNGTPDALGSMEELRAGLDEIRIMIGVNSTYLVTTFANRLDCAHTLARLRVRLFRTGYNRETGRTPLGDQETAPIREILELIEFSDNHLRWIDRIRMVAGNSFHELKWEEIQVVKAIATGENILQAQEVAACEHEVEMEREEARDNEEEEEEWDLLNKITRV
ncbi:hypothetical protein P167DRAFT_576051 [Morchella conica CCBAS932]|uniref:Uncharacterized protein n=1 Tax=Morchella conica CCBAS932 TaxID=1392247 RepID=A0A3N4KJI0_9PEZI|nr:hypothetical protein P167DRAFT_576051 [Morchella conica CCBAS932]